MFAGQFFIDAILQRELFGFAVELITFAGFRIAARRYQPEHFLVQSVPKYSPKKIVQMIKSITAREIFKACPGVKRYLWGGEFWTDGYFVSTVGTHGNEQMIKNYVQQQGRIEENGQLRLF